MASPGANGLTKAALKVVMGSPQTKRLEFLFNPTEYTIAKGANWKRPDQASAKSTAAVQFLGTNPQTLQMEIFFDDWEKREGKVASSIATLLDWTTPTKDSLDKTKPSPPILAFEWGGNPALASFRGFLKTVSAKYTMFDGRGTPLRGTASITLEEVPSEPSGTNPTSGSIESRRRHVLAEGDSLQSIAYAEYGDPNLWRALATFNGLDDPLRVPVGLSLLLPSLTEASELG
jgi:nucleoid-associated protein YgaU